MAFQLTKASCVAVGTFNIYIIQPGWLTSVGILPKGEVTIEANMSRPGFRLTARPLKSVWFVSPGKLAIETSSDDENCGAPMAQVLAKLQWTPVSGLGNNVMFRGPRAEIEPFPALEAAGIVIPEGDVELHRSVGVSIRRGDRHFTVQAKIDREVVELTGNVHSAFLDGGTTELAAKAAERFPTDKIELTNLFSEVFGVKFENVTSHS